MAASATPALPREWFQRMDESPDDDFYRAPRLVTHIDDATIVALTQVYRERIPAGAQVLDLMSSWVSHLPPDVPYARVIGLGMNAVELAHNPRLSEQIVHDLNATPELPLPEASVDVVINAVSVQYLTRPLEVFASVRRVLKPGGEYLVALSHRMFPTKAVAVWHQLSAVERVQLVGVYFQRSGAWSTPAVIDRSPPNADPLWVVTAARA